MSYEEWEIAGRPYWQCSRCRSVTYSIPRPDDSVCQSCREDCPTCGLSINERHRECEREQPAQQ